MIPVLETERLRLRAHTLEDFALNFALWGDAEGTRFIGGKPSNREEAWARFLRYPGHWQMRGFGYWLVEDKATGQFVGEVGFGDFKREMSPSFEGAPEQGWALMPDAHGKGYASEAVRATLNWCLDHCDEAPVCMISPENKASLRVAEKAGYREYARTVYKGAPCVLLRHEAASR